MEKIANNEPGRDANTIHPAWQFLIFAAVFVGTLVVGNVLGAGLVFALYGLKTVTAIAELNVTVPHFIPAVWILQLLGTTLPILAAPLLFARYIVNNTTGYLKPNFKFPWLLMLVAFFIMFAASPLMEYLTNLNQKMVLPPFLKWMRDSEDQAEKLTTALLQMDTVWSMLFNLIFIGLLTAIVEEFMFRGCMQTIFEKWFKNKHVAIWVTAILFSAFHMEFFGFLPRMFLGAVFGYFVVYSGSIWPAVWGHFINNGTAVVATYLYQHKMITTNPNQDSFNYIGYIISPIIVLILFWWYYKIAANKKPVLA
jgi:hypothetical protein